MTIPIIRQRAKRPKTRTGCKTCRARHIKCDEQRPECQKCMSTNRTCEGYDSVVTTLTRQSSRMLLPVGPPPMLRVLESSIIRSNLQGTPIRLSTQEWQGIQFFCGQTDFHLPGFNLDMSWETLAIQMIYSEPTIAYAVAALGSMQLARRGLPSSPVDCPAMDRSRCDLALRQYIQATSRMQDLINSVATSNSRDGIETILVACVVLMCFELVQGSASQAAMHLRNGLIILHSYVGKSSGKESAKRLVQVKRNVRCPLDTLTRLFVCLDCDITTFGANGNSYLHAAHDLRTIESPSTLPLLPPSFESLDEAAWHLSFLSNAVSHARGRLLQISETSCSAKYGDTLRLAFLDCRTQVESRFVDLSGNPDLAAELRQLDRYSEMWFVAISSMHMTSRGSEDSSRAALQIQYFATWFISATWRDTTETAGDRHRRKFAHFLNLVKAIMQSRKLLSSHSPVNEQLNRPLQQTSELLKGAMSLLFFLACKCRDSTIRWSAVSLLHDLKLQEGVFHSDRLAIYAWQIVELEEDRAREITGIPYWCPLTYEDVPEQARFMDVTLDFDASEADTGIVVWARPLKDLTEGFAKEKHFFAISEVRERMAGLTT